MKGVPALPEHGPAGLDRGPGGGRGGSHSERSGCLWTTNYVRKVKWETARQEWNPHKTQTKEANTCCFLLGLMDDMIEDRNQLRMAGFCDFQRKSQGLLLSGILMWLNTCALHLLLSVTGTWPRRTWRTPPSGWEPASVPPCAPCWASLCTERFSNSGDGTAPSASLCWLCSFPPHLKDS